MDGCHPNRRKEAGTSIQRTARAGFTLIELLVVLLVAGILAGIALPSWRASVDQARRAEGWTALMKVMQQQERHYFQHQTYRSFAAPQAGEFSWYSAATPGASAYEIRADACAGKTLAECVRLTALPGTPRVDARFSDRVCGQLSLDSSGRRQADGGSACAPR